MTTLVQGQGHVKSLYSLVYSLLFIESNHTTKIILPGANIFNFQKIKIRIIKVVTKYNVLYLQPSILPVLVELYH